ncbi:MAG: DUF3226 domain-containing protein [Planctomycetota bacterium]
MTKKKLLVEGRDDQYSVINLVKAYISWPEDPLEWPVKVECYEGVPNLLAPAYVSAQLKASDAAVLGILVDADESASRRWDQLRPLCAKQFACLPEILPGEGLISENGQRRLGVWIMPDNTPPGMLETFLGHLVPLDRANIWAHAESATNEAKAKGAPFKAAHFDKARIHAWLAWQDPAGLPFGTAITAQCLDPRSTCAEPFLRWFRDLYQV